ncbi:MAG TPA: nucleoside-diphosphate sugar epimerase/dehydratase [Planctomycetota bacterium]|nr:nucleoside-diphosphate sugar epimerase/dehydratase [Planctomycetota bacterium]
MKTSTREMRGPEAGLAAAASSKAGCPGPALILGTVAAAAGAWILAHAIRFEFRVPHAAARAMAATLPAVAGTYALAFLAGGVYRILWPYVGIFDLLVILRSCAAAAAVLAGVNAAFLPAGAVLQSVVVLHGLLTFLGTCGLFAAARARREGGGRVRDPEGPEPVLIAGAGDSGETLLRELQRVAAGRIRVIGFVDDAREKRGGTLRGVPVLGPVSRAAEIAARRGVRKVFVAIPSASGPVLRRIVAPLLEAGLAVKVLPPAGTLSGAAGFVPQLREVEIEDLLRREPVRLDETRIGAFLRDRRVLVTGAAGSIGSELCRQMLRFRPARLVALDGAESPLHDLLLELRSGPVAGTVVGILGDVTDPLRVRAVFETHAPEVVFHAAALKHVPLCESHVREAIRVNVGGTREVAEAARRARTARFVLISTDKAVNPSNVMGATKRAAELLVQDLDRRGPTRFSGVRFGNVLGSSGSVLRIFKAQLARGGPLTVTHPEMRRYFMTIPEAVQLVLQAAALGQGGEIFELDMGPPVRIVDLAEDLIRLSGLVPGRDVRIEFSGVRPGEKLFEELYLQSEKVLPTAHPKVFCLRPGGETGPDPALLQCLGRLDGMDTSSDPVLEGVRQELRWLVRAVGPVPAAAP